MKKMKKIYNSYESLKRDAIRYGACSITHRESTIMFLRKDGVIQTYCVEYWKDEIRKQYRIHSSYVNYDREDGKWVNDRVEWMPVYNVDLKSLRSRISFIKINPYELIEL